MLGCRTVRWDGAELPRSAIDLVEDRKSFAVRQGAGDGHSSSVLASCIVVSERCWLKGSDDPAHSVTAVNLLT